MVDLKELEIIEELRELGLTWEEISIEVPNFTDNDRKLFTGYKLGQQASTNSDLIKQARKSQMIRTSSKMLGIERSINNEQIRDISLHRTFTKQVIESIKGLSTQNTFIKRIPIHGEKHHIFTTADWHYNGDRSYLEVLNTVYELITEQIREDNITHIHLMELGDIIEGASLRTSQLMAVKSGMVNQVIEVAYAYIDLLTKLSQQVSITFYSVDSSNHTQLRNLGTKRNELVEEDLMLVFNQMIRTALPKLDMITGDDIYTKIADYNFFITHGHLVKNKYKFMEKIANDRNILIDYTFIGHFHHSEEIDLHKGNGYDKRLFIVPALNTRESSYENDYNMSSQAGIGYYVFEEGKGHIQSRKLVI
jgi:hypothetical protein